MSALPTLPEIRETFSYFDDWEDRYRYVIELGQLLPTLADDERTDDRLVHGCQSQVWLVVDSVSTGTSEALALQIDSDAFIVKGLAAILLAALDRQTPQAVLEMDTLALFDELGLLNHLSPSRGNGLRAMIERIQGEAQRRL